MDLIPGHKIEIDLANKSHLQPNFASSFKIGESQESACRCFETCGQGMSVEKTIAVIFY